MRPPGSGWVFLCALLAVCGLCPPVFRASEGPAAVCAGGRRPAREPPALRASLGASSRSPARPRHRPPAPRQVPAAPSTPVGLGVLTCGSARRLDARLGSAAHGHRSQAHFTPPGLSCPRYRGRNQCRMQFPRYPLKLRIHNVGIATFSDFIETSLDRIACDFSGGRLERHHGHRSQALLARWPGCLKPPSPLLACACVGLKPRSPLRVRNGRLWCSFRAQR